MSILIKGMEMPKAGELLCIDILPDGKVYIHLDLDNKQIATAVPVPLHGRLIDADANIAALQKCEDEPESEFAKICYGFAKKVIAACPTIIPAEEGE